VLGPWERKLQARDPARAWGGPGGNTTGWPSTTVAMTHYLGTMAAAGFRSGSQRPVSQSLHLPQPRPR